jgi:hypothetical protein
MKLIRTIIPVVMLTAASAFARIGERLPECIQRYGHVISTDSLQWTNDLIYIFSKGNFIISVVFDAKGKAVWIEYIKKGKNADRADEMSEVEQTSFLQSNHLKGWNETGYNRGSTKAAIC